MTTIEKPSTSEFDPAIRPQDDLFAWVNGKWIRTAEIPDDRSTWGSFEILREQSEADVRAIVEEAAASDAAAGTAERKIGDLYKSFMDEDTVETLGATALEPTLARIEAVGATDELLKLTGELIRDGVPGIAATYIGVDRGSPDRYVLYLYQGGLGLPDESYYRLDNYAPVRAEYVTTMAQLLHLAGAPTAGDKESARAAADRIMALETRMAEAHWERSAVRDAVKTYNLTTADKLRTMLPGAELWFEGAGIPTDAWTDVVVGQPDFLEALATALGEVDVSTWKEWLTWRVVARYAPYLSAEIVAEHFRFFGTVLTGAPTNRARWKRGVALVESALGEAVGRLYVDRHYPDKAAEQMNDLVANLLEAYRQRITTLNWMADDTRQRALAKLDAFTPKVGKPVKWKDYGSLEIDASDLIGNVSRAAEFKFAYDVNKIGGPVDRDEWLMTPQTVNAYYNPTMNEIVFPAAILQPPFFDADIDPAYNYGAIGAVIGHEIGHGFDDQGSRYDGDGALRDWWTAEDRERFDAKAKALIEQYSGFSPRALSEEHKVNGGLTVGENIGDLGGVTVAHHAYRLSLGGQEAPVIDGLTGDQRFFIGWARAWRTVVREAEVIRRLAIDPHSPPEFRSNVVRNVDAFHDAFGTEPGDGLWMEPEDRVSIW